MRPSHSIITSAAGTILIAVLSVSVTSPCYAVDWFVDGSITTSGGGAGWGNGIAFKYLRNALENPELADGDVIRVKGATESGLIYFPDQYWNGSTTVDTNNPTDSFTIDGGAIQGNISILGQHTGSGTTRNPTYRSILSGAIAASESSYSVVRFVGTLGSQTVLDGLEIRDGVADGGLVNPDYGNGGGIHVGTSAPDIRFCRIIGNRAVPNLPVIADQGPQDGLGGGLYARNGATLTLRGCEIAENIGLYGAGLCRRAEVTMPIPTSHVNLIATRFHANQALSPPGYSARGGGCLIDRWGGDVNIVASEFVANVADSEETGGGGGGGGGILIGLPTRCQDGAGLCGCDSFCPSSCYECTQFCTQPPDQAGVGSCASFMCCDDCPAKVIITNSIFVANSSRGTGGGGGIRTNRKTLITNSTIAGNESLSAAGAGGILAGHGACLKLRGCIVWGNSAPNGPVGLAQQMAPVNSLLFNIVASDIQDCGSPYCLTSTGSISQDPKFRNLTAFNVRLKVDSPCLNAGRNVDVPLDSLDADDDEADCEYTPEADLRERIRASAGGANQRVDMGAYERGCDADLKLPYDNVVDGFDLAILLGQWTAASEYSPCYPARSGDLTGDCKVNGDDLALLLGAYGPCTTSLTPPGCGSAGAQGPWEGGEAATVGGPPASDACGGGYDQFLQWLEADDWDSFQQWYLCATGAG